MYIITHIYIEDMRTKKVSECAVTSERSVLVKIVNNNFVPTLRGFHWYRVFCGSGTVSGIQGKQMTPAVAAERSVFSKNHDYNVSKRVFRVAVNTYVYTCISGSRCTWWQKTTNRRTHTHGTTTVTIIIKIIQSSYE